MTMKIITHAKQNNAVFVAVIFGLLGAIIHDTTWISSGFFPFIFTSLVSSEEEKSLWKIVFQLRFCNSWQQILQTLLLFSWTWSWLLKIDFWVDPWSTVTYVITSGYFFHSIEIFEILMRRLMHLKHEVKVYCQHIKCFSVGIVWSSSIALMGPGRGLPCEKYTGVCHELGSYFQEKIPKRYVNFL